MAYKWVGFAEDKQHIGQWLLRAFKNLDEGSHISDGCFVKLHIKKLYMF